MDLGACGGEDLLGGTLAGANGRVDGAPIANKVGVFSGEIEGVLDGSSQFENGIEGADGDVAIGSATEGIGLPVVGCATAELRAQIIQTYGEDAGEFLAGEIADLLAGALIERG